MKKIAALVLCLSLLLAGCAAPAATNTSTPADAAAVTVKNAAGQDVTMKTPPQRMVILSIWQAEMALDMVESSRIQAITPFVDNPVITACADKAAAVEKRVQSSAETIVALRPDLVLMDTFNDATGALTKSLQESGIAVLTMQSPTDFDQIRTQLTTLAKALSVPEKGKELITVMDATLARAAALVDKSKTPVKVMYYEDYYDQSGASAGMLCAYGKGSPFAAIAAAAGAVNVCTADNYAAVNKETVLNDWKPDLLIVPGVVYGDKGKAVEDNGAAVIAAMQKDKVLATLPAVTNNRLTALTEKYRSATSHYMANAAEELAKACYQ